MRPASSAGGTATAGPNTAAAAWRSRSAGSIGPTTRAARSIAVGEQSRVRPPPTSAARSVSADGRADTRATGPADACTADAPACTAAVADSGARPPGACTCTSIGSPVASATRATSAPRAAGAMCPAPSDTQSVLAPGSAARARASSIQRASEIVGRRPDDQGRDELGAGLLARPRDGAEGLRIVERVGGADPRDARVDRAQHEAAHQVGREGRVAPQVPRAHHHAHRRALGLAEHRPEAVPRALRARLEGRPGAARVERLEHPGPHLRERGRGGGEVVGPHGGAPRERGEVAQGRVNVTDGVGGRRHRTPFMGTGNGRLATGLTRGRSTPACGCRSSAGRPR